MDFITFYFDLWFIQISHAIKLCIFRAQMLMKSRLQGAQKGHGLLKKKADALQMRFRMILGKIIEVWDFYLCFVHEFVHIYNI